MCNICVAGVCRFRGPVTASATRCRPLQYYPPVLPKPKTEFYALVSHINTPSDFFIQLVRGPLPHSHLTLFSTHLLAYRHALIYGPQFALVCLYLLKHMLKQDSGESCSM